MYNVRYIPNESGSIQFAYLDVLTNLALVFTQKEIICTVKTPCLARQLMYSAHQNVDRTSLANDLFDTAMRHERSQNRTNSCHYERYFFF